MPQVAGGLTIRVDRNPVRPGEVVELHVTAAGDDEIVWGLALRMFDEEEPTSVFVLVGSRPGSGRQPRSYQPGMEYEVNDVGFSGNGTLRLLVPILPKGDYTLSLEYSVVRADAAGSARRAATTSVTVR